VVRINTQDIVRLVTEVLNEKYIFPEIAAKIGKILEEKLLIGGYKGCVTVEELTMALTTDLRTIGDDRHLGVFVYHPTKDEDMREEDDQDYYASYRLRNYGFCELKTFPGNIGYLNLTIFPPPDKAGIHAVTAMQYLANTDSVIIDLRDNGGGEGYMGVFLGSYFFSEPVQFTGMYDGPTKSTEIQWTYAYVPGGRMADTPLFILTSTSTFSAAEDFAYSMQSQKRAMIIGERTRGGAHPVDYITNQELGIEVMVPIGRSINPITGSNWQGVGVKPEIEVPAGHALYHARREALDVLIRKSEDTQTINELKWYLDCLEAEFRPVHLELEVLESYPGNYGPVKIWLEDQQLLFQNDGRRIYKLSPVKPDVFMFAGNELKLQFQRNSQGIIDAISHTFLDGYSRTYYRS
jgi:hypothetical protein